jgi:fructose-1,6-bisphosphatase/inositol monophosphatase family enzyme
MSTLSAIPDTLAAKVRLVEAAVLEAGRYLASELGSGRALEVSVKSDHSLVMNLDLESQRRILQKLGSDTPIVAEEDESSHPLIEKEGSYFLVDPLDGTTSCKRFLGERGGQVGYGPLVGYVHENRLSVASFYSVPHRQLFTAVLGQGAFVSEVDFVTAASADVRRRLEPKICPSLSEAGVLFFVGTTGEAKVVQHLKDLHAVENIYRFGGFANDCCRLAQGKEQLSVQFSVKPWDFTAVLIAAEAGLSVWADPLGKKVSLADWRIAMNNPLIVVQPSLSDDLFSVLSRMPG